MTISWPVYTAGLLLALLYLMVSTASAGDSCQERQSVDDDALCVEITGSAPDPNSREARWARGEVQRPLSRARYWDFIGPWDKHLISGKCWAVSPTVYTGQKGKVLYFVSVSVGGTWEQPQIIVQSEAGMEDAPTPFHPYKQNLGLWTESMPFVSIDRELGEHSILLGFSQEKSRRIVRNLAGVLSFQLRLRFAPVDEAFDSPNITLNGFTEAFEQVNACQQG